MEKIPNEILLKIFSYLEVQDLGRCARVSKKFHQMAYERRLWQKLPINLASVPVETLQHVMKHGIAYINIDNARILGNSLQFTKQSTVKYLILDLHLPGSESQKLEVMKNLLASCSQLEKLSCQDISSESDLDDIFQCIRQNSESLKCFEIADLHEIENENWMMLNWTKFTTAFKKCNNLEELRLNGMVFSQVFHMTYDWADPHYSQYT